MIMHDEEESKKDTNINDKIQQNFLDRRQIFLWDAVTDKSSAILVEKLLFLEYQNSKKPIYFFINSPGGVISSGMAIFDTIQMISSPVYTITMGMAASMGAILFCAGEKGHRYIMEHAKVMIHQPLISGQIVAPAIDIKIRAEEIKKTRDELNQILASRSGKKLKQIHQDTDRDYYMNASEAVQYGIADAVLKDLRIFDTE